MMINGWINDWRCHFMVVNDGYWQQEPAMVEGEQWWAIIALVTQFTLSWYPVTAGSHVDVTRKPTESNDPTTQRHHPLAVPWRFSFPAPCSLSPPPSDAAAGLRHRPKTPHQPLTAKMDRPEITFAEPGIRGRRWVSQWWGNGWVVGQWSMNGWWLVTYWRRDISEKLVDHSWW